mmetsp:Transcript_25042/g.73792  ORF Transcript_25042/g.73792 Transcript_25042/m.73792 type:complete len:241 (-) Transcript_25042:27-749(-)
MAPPRATARRGGPTQARGPAGRRPSAAGRRRRRAARTAALCGAYQRHNGPRNPSSGPSHRASSSTARRRRRARVGRRQRRGVRGALRRAAVGDCKAAGCRGGEGCGARVATLAAVTITARGGGEGRRRWDERPARDRRRRRAAGAGHAGPASSKCGGGGERLPRRGGVAALRARVLSRRRGAGQRRHAAGQRAAGHTDRQPWPDDTARVGAQLVWLWRRPQRAHGREMRRTAQVGRGLVG